MKCKKSLVLCFCGGCNDHYDRISIAEEIRAMDNKYSVTAAFSGVFDIAVVLCGCRNKCVDHSGISAKEAKYIVSTRAEGAEIVKKLLGAI